MIRVDIDKNTLEFIINKIKAVLAIKDDAYKSKSLSSIILNYGFVDGKAPIDNRIPEKSNIHQNYRHYKLPVTLDPLKYGFCIYEEAKSEGHLFILLAQALL